MYLGRTVDVQIIGNKEGLANVTTIAITMTTKTGKRKPRLSTQPRPEETRSNAGSRYDVSNSGPAVSQAGAKIAGRAVNNAHNLLSLAGPAGGRAAIATNLTTQPIPHIDTSVSDITSAAEQFNSYRFDETSVTMMYKKMMTLHLKEDMFRKLKFITSDAMLEFSTEENSLCGYVCSEMLVAKYQWGEYWQLVKKTTKKMIENQRTNATTAVKKGYRGKSKLRVSNDKRDELTNTELAN